MGIVSPWRERLFGDRGAGLRAGLVLAALAALTVYAEVAWDYTAPAIEACLADPARYDGKTVWMGLVRVERAQEGVLTVRDMRGTIVNVQAPAGTAAVGDEAALRGVFHRTPGPAGGPPGWVTLDMENGKPVIRPAPGGFLKRYGMFAASAGVLLYAAWRFLRTFRVRGGRIELKSQIQSHG